MLIKPSAPMRHPCKVPWSDLPRSIELRHLHIYGNGVICTIMATSQNCFFFFFSLYKQIFPLYSVQQRNNCCSSLLRKPFLLIVFRVFLCGSVSLPRVSWICSLHGIRCTAALFLSLERNWYKEYRLFFLFFAFFPPASSFTQQGSFAQIMDCFQLIFCHFISGVLRKYLRVAYPIKTRSSTT